MLAGSIPIFAFKFLSKNATNSQACKAGPCGTAKHLPAFCRAWISIHAVGLFVHSFIVHKADKFATPHTLPGFRPGVFSFCCIWQVESLISGEPGTACSLALKKRNGTIHIVVINRDDMWGGGPISTPYTSHHNLSSAAAHSASSDDVNGNLSRRSQASSTPGRSHAGDVGDVPSVASQPVQYSWPYAGGDDPNNRFPPPENRPGQSARSRRHDAETNTAGMTLGDTPNGVEVLALYPVSAVPPQIVVLLLLIAIITPALHNCLAFVCGHEVVPSCVHALMF